MAKQIDFRLQPILNMKANLVDQLEVAFAKSRLAHQQAVAKLNHLQQLKSQTQFALQQQQQGLLNQESIQHHLRYLQHLETCLFDQTTQVSQAEAAMEERRAELVKMMRDKQTLETLRNHHQTRQLKAINQKEAKAVDDLVTSRYGYGD